MNDTLVPAILSQDFVLSEIRSELVGHSQVVVPIFQGCPVNDLVQNTIDLTCECNAKYSKLDESNVDDFIRKVSCVLCDFYDNGGFPDVLLRRR